MEDNKWQEPHKAKPETRSGEADQPLLAAVFKLYGKFGKHLGVMINFGLIYAVLTESVNIKWIIAMYLFFDILENVIFSEMDKWMNSVTNILKYHNDAIERMISKLNNGR